MVHSTPLSGLRLPPSPHHSTTSEGYTMKSATAVASVCLALSLTASPAQATPEGPSRAKPPQQESPRAVDPGGPGTSCPPRNACWWQHSNYRGRKMPKRFEAVTWPGYMRRKDSTVQNAGTRGHSVVVYRLPYMNLKHYCLRQHRHIPSLGWRKRDRGMSHDWQTRASNCY